ncbi:MAG: MFS transporter [Candidatus Nanopelagicales bacterium]|nr:MFS transporter [Candidatus Nanopelagicales bacterium]
MTSAQRRITLGVSLIVGLSLLMATGLAFLIEPMALDLQLTDMAVENMLAIPSVAALVVVLGAGQLGDRFGHRRVIVWSAGAFTFGSVVIAIAGGAPMVQLGLAICAAAAVTMQIVGVGLLRKSTGQGPAQTSAFTTYGMVFPLAFLVLPVGTARVLEVSQWRLIPQIWIGGGLLILLCAFVFLQGNTAVIRSSSWGAPLLLGVALAAFARALAEVSHIEYEPAPVISGLVIGAGICLLCATLLREPLNMRNFLAPITDRAMMVLLACVALVSLVGLITFVSIALEFFYEMSPYEAALAIIPAQIGAVLGAKLLASWAMKKFGGLAGAGVLMFALAISMLSLIAVRATTPVWTMVAIATVFSFIGMGALTALNTEVMRCASVQNVGAISSFRTAASSMGAAVGVGILGTIVMSSVPVAQGVSAMSDGQLEALAASLRIDGVLSFFVVMIGYFFLRRFTKNMPSAAIA